MRGPKRLRPEEDRLERAPVAGQQEGGPQLPGGPGVCSFTMFYLKFDVFFTTRLVCCNVWQKLKRPNGRKDPKAWLGFQSFLVMRHEIIEPKMTLKGIGWCNCVVFDLWLF